MRNERERFAGSAMHLDFNGPLKFWRVTLEALAQSPVQFGVAGLPQFVADVDAGEINVAMAETQLIQAGLAFRSKPRFRRGGDTAPYLQDFIHPPAFLVFLRFAGVEHHAVARFQRAFEPDGHAIAQHARDFAEKHAAFFAEARMDELLVVGAAEPAGVQAARKSHLHFILTD